jgi:hypothetical protein
VVDEDVDIVVDVVVYVSRGVCDDVEEGEGKREVIIIRMMMTMTR